MARLRGVDRADLANLALLVGVAVALRAPALTSHGLYRDDAWPALATRTDVREAMRLGVTVPGFELALRAWLGFSRSTLWAQAPVLVASVATVVGVYLLARGVGLGRIAGLAAGGIMALSPVNVVYATRVKQYAFDSLGAVALLAAAVWLWQRPGSWPRWGLVAVVAAVTGFLSASTVPVAVVAMASCAWKGLRAGDGPRRPAVVVPLAHAGLLGVYAALVLGAVPPPLRALWGDNFVDGSSPSRLFESTVHVLDMLMAGLLYRHGPLGPVVLALVVLGAVAYRRDLAVLAVGPLAVALGLALAERVPLGGGRTDAYLYPGLALAVAMAVQKVLDSPPAVRLPRAFLNRSLNGLLAVGIVVFALTDGRQHVRSNPYPGADIAALQTAIRHQMEPGDGIVVSPFSRYPWALSSPRPASIVFSPAYTTGFTVSSSEPDELIIAAEYVEGGYDPAAAVRFAAGRPRVWHVVTDTPPSDTPPEAQAHEEDAERLLIGDGWRVVRRLDVHGAHAHLLEAPARAGAA